MIWHINFEPLLQGFFFFSQCQNLLQKFAICLLQISFTLVIITCLGWRLNHIPFTSHDNGFGLLFSSIHQSNLLGNLWWGHLMHITTDVLVFVCIYYWELRNIFLSGTVSHHIEKYEQEDPEFVAQVLHPFLLCGWVDFWKEHTTRSLQILHSGKRKTRLAEGRFNLRNFTTNFDELCELIEKNESSRVNLPSNVGPQADQRTKKTTESETFAKSSLNVKEKAEHESESKVLGLVRYY